jgi:MoaA/NifB/PqqE/SkfB family radical SAM enzyme
MAKKNSKFGYMDEIAGNCSPLPPELLQAYQQVRPAGQQQAMCYAPFRNLYFDNSGKVFSCSYNRLFPLGSIPEDRIMDIWQGERMTALRAFVGAFDTGLGCALCRIQMDSANFAAVKASMWDEISDTDPWPAVMEFSLTNRCNLGCKMCISGFSSVHQRDRHSQSGMKDPYGNDFFEELKPFLKQLQEAKFYGGEPFLCDGYFRIWDDLSQMNPECRITVQTNATIYNTGIENLLSRGNFHISVSLDAITPEVLEDIRRGAKADIIFANIERFRQLAKSKNNFFGITVSPTVYNTSEIHRIMDFCNANELPVYFTTIWFPVSASLWNLSSKQLIELSDEWSAYSYDPASPIVIYNQHQLDGLIALTRHWARNAEAANANSKEDSHRTLEELKNSLLAKMLDFEGLQPFYEEKYGETEVLRLKDFVDEIIVHAGDEASAKEKICFLLGVPPEILCVASGIQGHDLLY